MAKKNYTMPTLMDLTPEDDPNIHFGGSQGTSGYDSIFSFVDTDLEGLLGGWSDEELAALDTDHDLVITWEEYEAANNP